MINTTEIIRIKGTDLLLVVDAQRAFMGICNGGLGIHDGHVIVPVVQSLFKVFFKHRRVATLDMHPVGHISQQSSYVGLTDREIRLNDVLAGRIVLSGYAQFTIQQLAEELRQLPDNKLYVWNDHARVDTDECQLFDPLTPDDFWFVLMKGTCPFVDSFSAFRDNRWHSTNLAYLLRSMDVKRVFIAGLAYDFCVGFTAEDAAKEGFEAFVLVDATKSVNLPAANGLPGSVAQMTARLDKWNVRRIRSTQLLAT